MGRKVRRREFLKYTLAGGALALASGALPGGGEKPASASPPEIPAFDLDEATISSLQQAMASGRLTARDTARMYLERIEQVDKSGPAVNAVIEVNPDAIALADALDSERRAGRVRGPLHGIPVLIKDNIDTADKMRTSAGSLALAASTPKQDSTVAKKLRDAGAIILGKTNLSEWANFRSTHSTSGWSGRGGQTKNPYVLDRNPCGSSSGSGAGVSANLCALAVGTETDGSIVCPSSANGVVGIKPTLGFISRAGIVPIAHSQDTAGPMARTVADAAILLGALASLDPDPRDPATNGGKARADYTPYLDPAGLKGTRIGVARNYFGFNDKVDKLMETAIDDMKRMGAEMIDPADFPTAGKFDNTEFEVLLYEFKADLNAYLESLGPDAAVKSLKDIIDFNEKNREREMPFFNQEIMLMAEAKGPLTSKDYLKALKSNQELSRAKGIDAVFEQRDLDAMVAPTGGPAWTTDLINGDHYSGGSSTPAAVAGYPNINVPAGFIFGLPVGLSFFGPAFTEHTLIKIAYAFEQGTKHRRPPQFLLTIP